MARLPNTPLDLVQTYDQQWARGLLTLDEYVAATGRRPYAEMTPELADLLAAIAGLANVRDAFVLVEPADEQSIAMGEPDDSVALAVQLADGRFVVAGGVSVEDGGGPESGPKLSISPSGDLPRKYRSGELALDDDWMVGVFTSRHDFEDEQPPYDRGLVDDFLVYGGRVRLIEKLGGV
jgi:hypothetical protein